MFSNSVKSKNIISPEKKIEEKVNSDFVTHNMPESHRFSGQTFTSQIKPLNNKIVNAPTAVESHHKIGILIIGGGLILVGGLVYLGYSYIIKPNLSPVKAPVAVVNNTEAPEVVKDPEILATPTVEIISPSDPIISTSTNDMATSSDIILPEDQPVVTTPVKLSVVDSDADGLTDDEEKIIGTDPNKADTDNDGYLDSAEISSGYDPLVPAQKTSDKSVMLNYSVDADATIIYPAAWELTKSDSASTVVITDADKAFIQITYAANPKKLTPISWFAEEFSGIKPGEVISGNSWQGFFSQDGLAAYIFNKDLSKVYSFSCSPLTADTSSITLFNLMIKTLIIK